jgi:hypothetical protein
MHFYRRADDAMSEWIVVHIPPLYGIRRVHTERITPLAPIGSPFRRQCDQKSAVTTSILTGLAGLSECTRCHIERLTSGKKLPGSELTHCCGLIGLFREG